MRSSRRRARAVTVFVVLAVAGSSLAACDDAGGDDAATAQADTTSEPAAAAATAPAPTDAPTTVPATTTVDTTTEPATSAAPTGAAFYDTPGELPDEHGVLLRWERDDALAPEGAAGYRILYTSTDAQGQIVATSGSVLVPEGVSEPEAIVAYGHGTVGLGDQCAPSRGGSWEGPAPEDAWPDGVLPTELTPEALSRGWLVASTDYQGLGTEGDHTFLVGRPSGRAVLDAAQAATQLPDAGVTTATPVMVMGESQGGHAALFAGQDAAEYAPGLDVRGTVAFAPLVEIETILPVAGTAFPYYLLMGVAGSAAADPALDPAAVVTPQYVPAVDEVAESCLADAIAAYGDAQGVLEADWAADAGWSATLRDNTPGQVPSAVPVLVLHGEADATIPAALSQAYAEKACGLGSQVERTVYPGAGHGRGDEQQPGVLDAGATDAFAWADARLAGTPLAAPCATGG